MHIFLIISRKNKKANGTPGWVRNVVPTDTSISNQNSTQFNRKIIIQLGSHKSKLHNFKSCHCKLFWMKEVPFVHGKL